MKISNNGIPRRSRIDLFTPVETTIWQTIQAVEGLGAHTLLTEAVILLQQAKDKVADYVELEEVGTEALQSSNIQQPSTSTRTDLDEYLFNSFVERWCEE